MSKENIKSSHSSDISFAPKVINDYQFKKVELSVSSVSFLHENVKNLYISYELTCLELSR